MIYNFKQKRGFTLVELMVVISVIGILASIVYANFGSARGGARDDIRKSSLEEVRLALELYKAQNGSYPLGCKGSGNWSGTNHATYGASCTPNNYISGLTPDFIAQLPWDPNTDASQGYLYRSNGTDYKFMAWNSVEQKTIKLLTDEYSRSTTTMYATTYAVYSSGAATW